MREMEIPIFYEELQIGKRRVDSLSKIQFWNIFHNTNHREPWRTRRTPPVIKNRKCFELADNNIILAVISFLFVKIKMHSNDLKKQEV